MLIFHEQRVVAPGFFKEFVGHYSRIPQEGKNWYRARESNPTVYGNQPLFRVYKSQPHTDAALQTWCER